MDATRIVLLGKTGSGKSSLANIILGEEIFQADGVADTVTSECKSETRWVNGRRITLIDTPGFFDTKNSEEPEIVRCITECAPGPHAFLIVLKVERFTEHEQAVISNIEEYFSEEAFKYAAIVFTHGDQLKKGQTIQDFVRSNKKLHDLVKKCGGNCHVIDNKYWNTDTVGERSNKNQVEQLLMRIDRMRENNKDGCYTNEMLKKVEEKIQQEMKIIRETSPNMSESEIRQKAKGMCYNWLIGLVGVTVGALLGALLGGGTMGILLASTIAAPAVSAASAGAGALAGVVGTAVLVGIVGAAVVGAVVGGVKGYEAARDAKTPHEAAEMAAGTVTTDFLSVITIFFSGKQYHKSNNY